LIDDFAQTSTTKTGEGEVAIDRRSLVAASAADLAISAATRLLAKAVKLPIMVTEHGVGIADDTVRAWFIPEARDQLRVAMAAWVPVKGYCHWSRIDNFAGVFAYRDCIKSHPAGA
jgi:beta-glucosidase/6-phospho-beta-glucosidase/beta-galactosidase